MADLRFPIGPFEAPGALNAREREHAIRTIAGTPQDLHEAVAGLSESQLDTPYRPGGWTSRQVVHHLPDSHMNAYIRLKLTLTEETPTIRTYDEGSWAELPDASGPIELSLRLLENLHVRWVYLWERLGEDDWSRELRHPDLGQMRVDELLAFYAWHGPHHVAHITQLRRSLGW